MNSLSIKLGYWSALLSAMALLIFTLCFMAIVMTSPLFVWTNLADYVQTVTTTNQFYKHLAQLMMLLFAPLFVVLVNAIHEYAPDEKNVFSRLGMQFAGIFATLFAVQYFVQLTAVRNSISHNQLAGLELFIQANPDSVTLAFNMLGVTLFLGLASLCMAPVFGNGRLEQFIKIIFFINAFCCLVGGIAFIFQWELLINLLINFGMGGALTIVTIALTLLFRRMSYTGATHLT
jgi:hypothetical protein